MRPAIKTGKFLYEDDLEDTILVEIDEAPETLREIEVAEFWADKMNAVPEQRKAS